MASKATNKHVDKLAQRHTAEKAALAAALSAADAVGQAQAVVTAAEADFDLALATLAALMPTDSAAELVEVGAPRVQQAVRRAPVEAVTGRVAELTGGAPIRPRRGRPPGSRATRPVLRDGGVPDPGGSMATVPVVGEPGVLSVLSEERSG
jgi:hypothetical protein